MKRTALSIVSFFIVLINVHAQDTDKVYSDVRQLYGVYYINDFKDFESPDIPKGYVPVCISHYGRHGARYQDSEEAYTKVLYQLTKAREDNALTEYGKEVCAKTEAFYALCKNHHGELTHVGWEQHKTIARLMYSAYPRMFSKNAVVTANSSFSQRCMMSMTAFCVGLKEVAPGLDLYAETSRTLLDETNPGDKQNVNYVKTTQASSPWGMSYDEFLKTRISSKEATDILLRIFTNEEYIKRNLSCIHYCQSLYNMIAGMHCVNDELAIDDLFTESELFRFYEAINYGFFEWGALNKDKFKPIIKCMVRIADEDMKENHPSVRLRFGHDTNLLGILHLLNVDNLGVIPEDINDLSKTWNCFMTPMAANFELVLYRHKKSGNVLVLPLLNGKVANIGVLPKSGKVGKLYKWNDLKSFVDSL